MRQPISTDSVISARVPRFEHDEENHERLTAAVIWCGFTSKYEFIASVELTVFEMVDGGRKYKYTLGGNRRLQKCDHLLSAFIWKEAYDNLAQKIGGLK